MHDAGSPASLHRAWGPIVHEMALAEEVMQIVQDAARREGLRRVRALWLEIGQLSSVEPDAMRFCFEAAARNSVAEGARLEIVATSGAEMRVKELEGE